MADKLNGPAIGAVAVGGIILYSGARGYSVLKAAQNIIQGKAANTGQSANLNIFSQGAGSGNYPTSNSAIANDALRYVGHQYKYGGAPGLSGNNPWDCSSMESWVLGHDFGMVLPGGIANYNGQSHGPVAMQYLWWKGAKTIGHHPSNAQAGDLVVWQTHCGFAIGNEQMVSALNPAKGTRITSISDGAPFGEYLFVRRIIGSSGTSQAASTTNAGGRG